MVALLSLLAVWQWLETVGSRNHMRCMQTTMTECTMRCQRFDTRAADNCTKKLSARAAAKSRNASYVLQDLQNLARDHALPTEVQHDVAANASEAASTAYTATVYTDLQEYQGMTCSVLSNSSLNSAIKACASLNNGTCCVEYGRLFRTVVRPGA